MLVELGNRSRRGSLRVAPWLARAEGHAAEELFALSVDRLHPIEWLALARRSPTLAECLQRAVRADRPRFEHWWTAFVHRPNWAALVESLQACAPLSDDDKRLRLASMTLALSRGPSQVPAGECELQLLANTAESPPSTMARAWELSRLILQSARAEADDLLSLTVDERADMGLLHAAATAGDIASPQECLAEARTLLGRPALDWTPALHDRLLAAAALAMNRQHGQWQGLLSGIERAGETKAAGRALFACLEAISLEGCALWIDQAAESQGRGWIANLAKTTPHEFAGTRGDFEWALPHSMRSALRLSKPHDAEIVGYFECDHDRGAVKRRRRPLRDAWTWFGRRQPAFLVQEATGADSTTSLRFADMVAEFAAGAGHEINNPLGAIRGKTDWLLRGEPDPARRHALQKILDQVARIRTMIRDLRFIGTSTALPLGNVEIGPAIDRSVAAVAMTAPDVAIQIIPSGAGARVAADAELLERAIVELVRNAAQAAGPGGNVVIRHSLSERDRIDLEICDSGPGVSDEIRAKLLGPFFSGRSAGRGLGMGLAVVRQIVDLFGGSIFFSFTRPSRVLVTLRAAGAADQSGKHQSNQRGLELDSDAALTEAR